MNAENSFIEQLGGEVAAQVVEMIIPVIEERICSDKILYTEEEAAGLLGLEPHTLGSERRDGRIHASKLRKGRVRYLRSDLIKYANDRRVVNPKKKKKFVKFN